MKAVKAALALLLLPAFPGLWFYGVDLIRHTPWHKAEWPPLAVFLLGISAWLIIHQVFPRWTRAYVFGHEATHALAVWMSGGRVSGFHVGRDGGHIVSDRSSAFIALSPYLLPFYPLVLGVVWSVLSLVWPELARYTILFLAVWGLSWGFHFAFTGSLLKTAQEDFASQGFLFSWVVILLANAATVLLVLTIWLRPFGPAEAVSVLARSLLQGYQSTGHALHALKTLLN